MKQILHIFQKDARRHWPEILVSWLLLGLFTHHELHPWSKQPEAFSIGQFFLRARYITPTLLLFWCFLIVRIVHGESLVGDRQWWVTKPYVSWKLLSAKILFIIIFIALPLFRAQLFLLHGAAFPVLPYLGNIFVFQLSLLLVLFLPSLLLGSLTKNLGQALLGVAFVFLSLFGIFWAMTKIPSSTTYSTPPVIEHVENLLFLACIIAVPTWQFARRKRWMSLGLLFGLLLTTAAIAAFTPYGKIVERDYPMIAVHDAPVQITFKPFSEMNGRRMVWPDTAGEINLYVPVRVSGILPGTTVVVDAMKVTTDSPEDSHWSRGWFRDWIEIWPEDQRKALRYEIDRREYEKIKTKHLHLHIELALSEYQDADARTLTIEDGVFFDEALGACRNNSAIAGGIQCLKPIRPPAYAIRFDPASTACPLGEDAQKMPANIVFHAWNRSSSGEFPDPSLNPVSDYSLWFQPVSLLANSNTEAQLYMQPRLCAGAEVRFAKPVFKRPVRIQFDIPGARLQDLAEADWR
jgi:hypothetical protein